MLSKAKEWGGCIRDQGLGPEGQGRKRQEQESTGNVLVLQIALSLPKLDPLGCSTVLAASLSLISLAHRSTFFSLVAMHNDVHYVNFQEF